MTRTQRDVALIAVIAIMAAAVMLLPSFPGLIDLPGHTARYHVELEVARSPVLQRYYSFNWTLVPNLGVDLLVYPLARIVGLEPAVRLIVAAIPALMIAGMLSLGRIAHGRLQPTALLAVPCAFGYPFTFGFVNYCLAAALAFCAAAIWLHLTLAGRPAARLAFGIVASPLLMVAHATGWGLFGLIAFGMALASRWKSQRPHRALAGALLDCAGLAWPLLVLVVVRAGSAGEVHGWFDIGLLARSIVTVLRERFAPVDVASALLLYAVALLPLLLPRRVAAVPVLLVPAVLVWTATLILPSTLFGSAFANTRLMPQALALSVLAVGLRRTPPAWTWAAALAFVAIRLTMTGSALLAYDRHIQPQLAILSSVEPGSRMLGFRMTPCTRQWEPPRSQNIQLLATARRDVLINSHWSEPGAQLMTINYPIGGPVMRFGTNSVTDGPCARWGQPLATWIANAPLQAFDYLWLLDVPPHALPKDGRLHLIRATHGSFLYRIGKAPS